MAKQETELHYVGLCVKKIVRLLMVYPDQVRISQKSPRLHYKDGLVNSV